ncbi:DNA-binding MarR family transcriptional regulator [Arcticibacter tournemirensis]|uniref:MarR family transcriptional regulator n=1 Tax=Arcticibacter tournemirensis TaxID=699437 RepID=A0A4Q0ME80_9SPHI|nr:MarR family transcriptional regulator [Arcticibacter tournemirensis]KAA8486365.1 MarR family transcriptional regulator [Arcticibacter tournemirensis]RXF71136.1 MarR family transcriptional regulator [Arcticibacter tournemirensis]TQM52183.1 DNA-binding MarR family transcriptional regulator [Arcticibacter tournemirensis]
MELEKEIHQTKFKNDYHKIVVNIIYSYSWVTGLVKERLSKQEVTLQQYNILRILRGQYPKPATINLLKERMLDKMSDASRIVERLVQKELVTRTINKTDRRAVDILITEKGLDVLKDLDPVITPEDVLKQNITEEEAAQLNLLLDKLRG